MSHTNKYTQLENDRTSWLRKFSRPAALTMKLCSMAMARL